MFLLFSLCFIQWKCETRKCESEVGSINVPLDYSNESSQIISLKVKRINSTNLKPPIIVLSEGNDKSNINLEHARFTKSFSDTNFYFVGYRGIDSNLTFNDKSVRSIILTNPSLISENKLMKIANTTAKKLNLSLFWTQQRARDIIEFIHEENLPKCNIFAVGPSGSLIAQQLISLHPQYFEKAVIVGSSILQDKTGKEDNQETENTEEIEDQKIEELNDEDNIYEDEDQSSKKLQPNLTIPSSIDPHYQPAARLLEKYRQKCLKIHKSLCKYPTTKWMNAKDFPLYFLLLVNFKRYEYQWTADRCLRNINTAMSILDITQAIASGSTITYMAFQQIPVEGSHDYKWMDMAMHHCANKSDDTILYPSGIELICPYLPKITADVEKNFSVPVLLVNGEFDIHEPDEVTSFYEKYMSKNLLEEFFIPDSDSINSIGREDVNFAIQSYFSFGNNPFHAAHQMINWKPMVPLGTITQYIYLAGFGFSTIIFLSVAWNSITKRLNYQENENIEKNKEVKQPIKNVYRQPIKSKGNENIAKNKEGKQPTPKIKPKEQLKNRKKNKK